MRNEEEATRNEEILLAAEAAEIKGVTRRAVYEAIKDGRLIASRRNGIWLIRRADLDAWQIVGHRPRTRPAEGLEP